MADVRWELSEAWQAAVDDQKISLFDSNCAHDGCTRGLKK